MLDKFIFENHLGQRFEGLPNRVFMNYSDLRDYSWSFDTINNRISHFYRDVTQRGIPLVVYCNSDEEAVAIMNRLHELAETDIVAKIPGRIYVGDYYTMGYITASTKSNYLIRKKSCKIELTLTSDDPSWYKETNYSFMAGGETSTDKPQADTLNITANGEYDVSRYTKIVVNVAGGSSGITATDDGNGNVTLLGVTASSERGNVTIGV